MTESDLDARLARLLTEPAPRPDAGFADRVVALARHDLSVRQAKRRAVERIGIETLGLAAVIGMFVVLARAGPTDAGFGDVVGLSSPAMLGLVILALWLVAGIRPVGSNPERGR